MGPHICLFHLCPMYLFCSILPQAMDGSRHPSSCGPPASGPQNAHPTPSTGSVSGSPLRVAVLSLPRPFKINGHSLTGPSDGCLFLPQINVVTSYSLGWASAMPDERRTFPGTMRSPSSFSLRSRLVSCPPCSCWVPKVGQHWKRLYSRSAPQACTAYGVQGYDHKTCYSVYALKNPNSKFNMTKKEVSFRLPYRSDLPLWFVVNTGQGNLAESSEASIPRWYNGGHSFGSVRQLRRQEGLYRLNTKRLEEPQYICCGREETTQEWHI